jgi:hypothetical protein
MVDYIPRYIHRQVGEDVMTKDGVRICPAIRFLGQLV